MHGKTKETEGNGDGGVGRNRWLIPVSVAACGCIGGLTAWVWSYVTGESPENDLVAVIFSNMFLGAVAGYIGVYALKLDSTRFVPHTLALALLWGFAWEPTLEAGREYINTQTSEAEAKVQQEYAEERIDQLKNASTETAPELIRELESVSQELRKSEVTIKNPRLKLEVNSVVAHSVAAINDASQLSPKASAEALVAVEEAAAARQNIRVLRSLQTMRDRQNVETPDDRQRQLPKDRE